MPVFDARGEGPAILFLHGLGATGAAFHDVRARLPGFRTVCVDLPHHGRARPWSVLDPKVMAERLAGKIAEPSFFVVGHSFGGVVALELAARAPERVTGVCALAAPVSGLSRLKAPLDSRFAEWTTRIAAHVTPSAAAVRAYLKLIWGDGPKPTPGHVQGYLLAMEAEGHHAGSLQALRSLAAYSPSLEALRRMPLTLVFGERDPLVPATHGSVLARALGARVEILRGAGHCLPEECPEEIAALIRAANRTSAHVAR